MSVEFKKIVLEKLKVLDQLNSKVNELSEDMYEIKEKVNDNTGLINNLTKKVENNTTLINNLSEKVENNTTLISILSKKVDHQGLNFARFENEFNIKVQGLFDSFVANTESHLAYDKFISALNAKTYNQDLRISVLEDYFKCVKLLAKN